MATTADDPKQTSTAGPIPCSSPYPKPPANAYDEIITLTVGKPGRDVPKVFRVYRGVLCHYSGYFKTMLNGDFKEGGSNSLTLDDEDPSVFQIFYDYINTGDWPTDNREPGSLAKQAAERAQMIQAYRFADYYLAQAFKNQVLDLWFAKSVMDWKSPVWSTRFIYGFTAENASLRRLHSDIIIETSGLKALDGSKQEFPKDFLWDIVTSCRDRKMIPGSSGALVNGKDQHIAKKKALFCEKYHDHTELESRPVTRKTVVLLDSSEESETEDQLLHFTSPASLKRDVNTAFGSDVVQSRAEDNAA